MTKFSIMVTVEVEAGDADEIRRSVDTALTDTLRKGVTGARDEITWDIREGTGVSDMIAQIARMDLFEEAAIREEIEEGATDPREIEQSVFSAQADQDWMESQNDALQALVRQARVLEGDGPPESLLDRIQRKLAEKEAQRESPSPD